MKTITFVIFALITASLTKIQAQCNITETITVCDMTIIDGDSNGTPDGIINLYDAYNAIPGLIAPISLVTGNWFDPNYNFALEEATGDLYLWDLDDSSTSIGTHQFQLIDMASACPDGILVTLNVVLGPFEGNPLPPVGVNDANVSVCETELPNFDLFQVFESQPSPHMNGVWAFLGNLGDPSNFLGLTQDGKFDAQIPYVPGGNLIEFDVFEFSYTVPGIAPCSTSETVNFKVEVIRDVLSGIPSSFDICETSILAGLWDADIDLRDNAFLVGEDIEGTWSSSTDPTGQISDPLDSVINIREVYDFLKLNDPRFECAEFVYTYTVEARSTLTACPDKMSDIVFRFYEPIKPFQQDTPLEICADGTQPNTVNLYSEITFTTENGILYDYPFPSCTSWSFISGPSDLGFSMTPGIINLTNITNADVGTYVFRYTVFPSCNNCPNGGSSSCPSESADIVVNINPFLYAGENANGLDFCETDPAIASPLNLVSLLNTNGIDDPIYQGPLGSWEDLNTGGVILNPFTVPPINDQQTFNFRYNTVTADGCIDSADLSFTVYEQYSSGVGTTFDVCNTASAFDLFDLLTGSPNTNGTWTGPNGYTSSTNSAMIDPSIADTGNYIYIVPDNLPGNILCNGNQATITLSIFQSPNAGSDVQTSVCKSDLQIDLLNELDPAANPGGVFVDLDGTNTLTGSVVDVSQLNAGVYNFQYQIQGNAVCPLAMSLIELTVLDVALPTASNQTFCASDGATIADLQVSNGQDYNWYDDMGSTMTLSQGTVLLNGEDYFVAALDNNGCESARIPIVITLLPLDDPNCDDCLKDGVSANDDGENDVFDLCGLPMSFPDFEIKVFNRYGTIVYKGNRNTPLFDGTSNVSLTIGDKLPSSVYFYVFDPNDGITQPFQGSFYLSR